MKKSLFAIVIAAVLTFVSAVPVHANTTSVQTKSITVATDPICCCLYIQMQGQKIYWKTRLINFRSRVDVS